MYSYCFSVPLVGLTNPCKDGVDQCADINALCKEDSCLCKGNFVNNGGICG